MGGDFDRRPLTELDIGVGRNWNRQQQLEGMVGRRDPSGGTRKKGRVCSVAKNFAHTAKEVKSNGPATHHIAGEDNSQEGEVKEKVMK